jgi:hypothetical protein
MATSPALGPEARAGREADHRRPVVRRADRRAVGTGDDRVVAVRRRHAIGEQQHRRLRPLRRRSARRCRRQMPSDTTKAPEKTGSVSSGTGRRSRPPAQRPARSAGPDAWRRSKLTAPPAPREPEAPRDPGWRSGRGRRRRLPEEAGRPCQLQLIPSASSSSASAGDPSIAVCAHATMNAPRKPVLIAPPLSQKTSPLPGVMAEVNRCESPCEATDSFCLDYELVSARGRVRTGYRPTACPRPDPRAGPRIPPTGRSRRRRNCCRRCRN